MDHGFEKGSESKDIESLILRHFKTKELRQLALRILLNSENFEDGNQQRLHRKINEKGPRPSGERLRMLALSRTGKKSSADGKTSIPTLRRTAREQRRVSERLSASKSDNKAQTHRTDDSEEKKLSPSQKRKAFQRQQQAMERLSQLPLRHTIDFSNLREGMEGLNKRRSTLGPSVNSKSLRYSPELGESHQRPWQAGLRTMTIGGASDRLKARDLSRRPLRRKPSYSVSSYNNSKTCPASALADAISKLHLDKTPSVDSFSDEKNDWMQFSLPKAGFSMKKQSTDIKEANSSLSNRSKGVASEDIKLENDLKSSPDTDIFGDWGNINVTKSQKEQISDFGRSLDNESCRSFDSEENSFSISGEGEEFDSGDFSTTMSPGLEKPEGILLDSDIENEAAAKPSGAMKTLRPMRESAMNEFKVGTMVFDPETQSWINTDRDAEADIMNDLELSSDSSKEEGFSEDESAPVLSEQTSEKDVIRKRKGSLERSRDYGDILKQTDTSRNTSKKRDTTFREGFADNGQTGSDQLEDHQADFVLTPRDLASLKRSDAGSNLDSESIDYGLMDHAKLIQIALRRVISAK